MELEQNFDEENEILFLRTNDKDKKFQGYYKNNNIENINNNINNSGFNNRYDEEGNLNQGLNYGKKNKNN